MIEVLNWFAAHPFLGVILVVLAGSFMVGATQALRGNRVHKIVLVVMRKDQDD